MSGPSKRSWKRVCGVQGTLLSCLGILKWLALLCNAKSNCVTHGNIWIFKERICWLMHGKAVGTTAKHSCVSVFTLRAATLGSWNSSPKRLNRRQNGTDCCEHHLWEAACFLNALAPARRQRKSQPRMQIHIRCHIFQCGGLQPARMVLSRAVFKDFSFSHSRLQLKRSILITTALRHRSVYSLIHSLKLRAAFFSHHSQFMLRALSFTVSNEKAEETITASVITIVACVLKLSTRICLYSTAALLETHVFVLPLAARLAKHRVQVRYSILWGS